MENGKLVQNPDPWVCVWGGCGGSKTTLTRGATLLNTEDYKKYTHDLISYTGTETYSKDFEK